MFYIGCHLSSSKGFYNMGKTSLEIGANTFQFFTRNPRGSKAKKIDITDCNALLNLMETHHFAPIIAHAPYTINACSSNPETRQFAQQIMKEDLERMQFLPNNYYNFHPGNHLGQGSKIGIQLIANQLNTVMNSNQKTTVLLETMAGKGTEIGRNFEELKEIIELSKFPEKIGVCLDTCHIFDGGYDIVNHLENVLEHFDKIINLKKLKAIHLNDSKNSFGSHKDRHEKIGKGYIGINAIIKIITHPYLKNLPFILETPNDISGYANEIQLLREASKNE